MASTPPGSPAGQIQRPRSAMIRSNRSSSRLSMSSRHGGGSRASDEDGKTAVKVAIRVRPPLKSADPGYDLVPQRFRGSVCQVTTSTSLAVDSAQGRKLFVFDRVFGEDIDQEGIWEYLNESVNSFVQGYNVSILAYGQSGAGKSYTMGTTGPREQGDPKIMGVVPRAASVLFEKLCGTVSNRMSGSGLRTPSRYSSSHSLSTLQTSSRPSDKNWQLRATYVEIYNEQLRDLLIPETVPQHERPSVAIREDAKGRIILTGLQQVAIHSVDDLLNALNFGSSIRQTDSTAVNAKSSRSHAVFSLNLIQKKSKTTPSQEKRFSVPIEAMSGTESWVTVDSKLHFVDLAGSERLKNTGAQGERAKEGISINAGLASLGKVISQLSSRSPGAHVSYRDSKLTRLLQDSLGGNAITYMVACVNPAEFHLSETLNTVQYAQRARAIQSKPQIQQVHDDSDKQAVIDRLRAEVSFLRDQIRLSERAERRNNAPQEKVERQHEREMELQNQLLDMQENYTALSQRHAKLISEITKARDDEEDTPMLKDAIGDSALERLKRSNSFAAAVEQVVLEYEKTIQSLEASLSSTRTSLASSESSLLEKETKIAYMETVTQQLQARIQKAMDREASSENYLRDLEARIDGIASGEEKNTAIIQDLRKELTRAKENEASCEEYISTLEERLAEAEQDHEMMQREIDRLAHVVERQRSIGKLDNLLYEFDNMRQNESRTDTDSLVNGHSKHGSESLHTHKSSTDSAVQTNGHPLEDGADKSDLAPPAEGASAMLESVDDTVPDETISEESRIPELDNRPSTPEPSSVDFPDEPQSPAQSKFVNDKLESVTQELFDLRVEHEQTMNEYEELGRKYQIALNTLAEMQDAVDEARHAAPQRSPSPQSSRPTSFLADAGVNGLKEEDGQPSSSRTLSSELSLVGESSTVGESFETTETSDADTAQVKSDAVQYQALLQKEEELTQEMEKLRRLNAEKEENMVELTESYAQLQEKHQDTLDYVEDLKVEVQRAQLVRPPISPTVQVLRRKSSQNIITNDRANRSFASLRGIAMDNFEGQTDVVHNFELNLNTLMTELKVRSDRVQTLEAEMAAVRKEMETKMTIISGLTRERSSLKASSPLDISVVSSMQDQLVESENQLKLLQEAHAAREKELEREVDSLKASLEEARLTPKAPSSPLPIVLPGTPASESGDEKHPAPESPTGELRSELAQLQIEAAEWKSKHLAAVETARVSEQKLLSNISELEASLQKVESEFAERVAALEEQTKLGGAVAEELEREKEAHREQVLSLRREVDEHKASAAANAERLADLEQSYENILRQVEEDAKSKALTDKELQTHRDLVSNLEHQIEEHKSAIAISQQGLDSLRESHTREVDRLNTQLLEANARHAAELAHHTDVTAALQEDLSKSRTDHEQATSSLQEELSKTRNEQNDKIASLQEELRKSSNEVDKILQAASAALGGDTDSSRIQSQIEMLADERKRLLAEHERASADLKASREELAAAETNAQELEGKIGELKTINEETLRELEIVSEKEKKSSRLVEELEDQLNTNFDQHQAANNRLSALQTERQLQLEESIQMRSDLERELDESRARLAQLESQLADSKRNSHRESLDPRDATLHRSNSSNSTSVRKSTSHNSLPSPPPAIPLPPLPGSPPPGATAPSPPTSRHQSKDIAQAQLVEDQEARIRTIEKHLFAEKQLTATLEEALTDLEASSQKTKSEMEGWKKKCVALQQELDELKKQQNMSRYSLQAVEEERNARMRVEAERANLEARMAALSQMNKKKKKSALNCF